MCESGRVAHRVTVHGEVQGVFFRASTRRQAQRHGVGGWVRNCPDGTVEAWLEGPRGAVSSVVRWMRSGGPPAARVEDVDVEEAPPEGLDHFEIRH